MSRRYTTGQITATFDPGTWTVSLLGAGQGDTFDVSEFQRYPMEGGSYAREGYADLGAWLIAGLLSGSPFWGGLATYNDAAERFEIEVTS